ncbi:MAG: alpha-amylase [Calditrichaeota bacterium]|nr:alpha-amylase [Calditrichota bacterium]
MKSCRTILEINTRLWLQRLGKGKTVSLGDVGAEHFDRWQSRCVEAIWLMGIWKPSPASREIARTHEGLKGDYSAVLPDWTPDDVVASPYALIGYEVNPELGGEEGLKKFRENLHARGIKLILDFVPSHTACDHPWIKSHPEYYVQGTEEDLRRDPVTWFGVETEQGPKVIAHGRDPYFPAWSDTAQPDMRKLDTQLAVANELLSVASRCDGVRCDMAMLVLSHIFTKTWGGDMREFWPNAIRQVREKYPEFILIAEVYWGLDLELNEMGFDYTYDKDPVDWATGPTGFSRVQFDYDEAKHRRRVRFLENHDEERIASRLSFLPHRAAATWVFTLPSANLFYQGQFSGAKLKAPVQLNRMPHEKHDPQIAEFYDVLMPIVAHEARKNGSWKFLHPRQAWQGNESHWQILSHAWDHDDRHLRVFVNWADYRSQCWVDLSFGNLQGKEVILRDMLSDKVYIRDGVELMMRGIYLDLEPWEAHAFDCEVRDAAAVTDESEHEHESAMLRDARMVAERKPGEEHVR